MAGAGASHGSPAYPSYYSSYYHYYYGYSTGEALQQQQEQQQQLSQTPVTATTEHGLNHGEATTISSSFGSSYGLHSSDSAAQSSEFDLAGSSSSTSSNNSASGGVRHHQTPEGDYPGSPTASVSLSEYDILAQQCSLAHQNSPAEGGKTPIGFSSTSISTPGGVFATPHPEAVTSHLSYSSGHFNQVSQQFPSVSAYEADQRTISDFPNTPQESHTDPEGSPETDQSLLQDAA